MIVEHDEVVKGNEVMVMLNVSKGREVAVLETDG